MDDLVRLGPNATDGAVLQTIKERLLDGRTHTWLSPHALVVSGDPESTAAASNAHASLHASVEDWTSLAHPRPDCCPSVPALAGRALFHLRRAARDQAVFLHGTSEAVSSARLQAVRAIVALSRAPRGKKGAKLAVQVAAAELLHRTLVSASSGDRTHAYLELQFSAHSRLVGYKSLDVCLDTGFFSLPRPLFSRSFDLFHALVAGADDEERSHLHLPSVSAVQPGTLALVPSVHTPTDAPLFDAFKRSLARLSYPRKALAGLLELIAALIHLGQLDFEDSTAEDATTCRVSSSTRSNLDIIAPLLGLSDISVLEHGMLQRLGRVGVDMATVFLDSERARVARDSLISGLYGSLVRHITDYVNARLSSDDFEHLVALVPCPNIAHADIRRSDISYIELLASNLFSERMHSYSLHSLLSLDDRPETKDNLVPPPPYLDPSITPFEPAPAMRVLTHRPGGLVHIIEDQSRRRAKTDNSMFDAIMKRWGHHPSMSCRPRKEPGRSSSFTLSHWQSDVSYSVEGFLEQNARGGDLTDDWLQLLGGSVATAAEVPTATTNDLVGGSKNPLVRQILAEDALALAKRSGPKPKGNAFNVTRSATLDRKPSTRKPKDESDTAERETTNQEKPRLMDSVDQFADSIVKSLAGANYSYVFHIRPNDLDLQKSEDLGMASNIDGRFLKTQIENYDLVRAVNFLRDRTAVHMNHAEFWNRYVDVDQEIDLLSGVKTSSQSLVWHEKSKACQRTIQQNIAAEIKLRADANLPSTNIESFPFFVGNTNVYLGYHLFRRLEDALRSRDDTEAKHIRERSRIGAMYSRGEEKQSDGQQDETDPFDDLFFSSSYHGVGGYDADPGGSTTQLPLVANSGPMPVDGEYEFDSKSALYGEDDDGGERMALNRPYSTAFDDTKSLANSEAYGNMFRVLERPEHQDHAMNNKSKQQTAKEIEVTGKRKRWLTIVWLLTWWIPGFLLGWLGRMKRKDIRMAWREKLAINIIIWFLCGIAIFVVAVLGPLICPTQHVFTQAELEGHGPTADDVYTAIRGEVFNLGSFAKVHPPAIIPEKNVLKYGGRDATDLFPLQINALCAGANGDGDVSPWVTLESTNSSEDNAQYHDFRASTNDVRPDWYYESMILLRSNYRKGFMGLTTRDVRQRSGRSETRNSVILDGGVYDITQYVVNGNGGSLQTPNGTRAPDDADRSFLNSRVVDLIASRGGSDITKDFNDLNLAENVKQAQKVCLRNIFYIGKVDTRNSAQCQFARYILLAMSILIVVIIGVKFLAAMNFTRTRHPEEFDRFVICQIPCYTEGEESLRNTLESIAATNYDDKRKLMFIICDGMIVGSGNDRTTPRIVLDILGCDPGLDPDPLSFESLGDGTRKHNMAKVYSGLYEHAGHIVPYVVVVKVGKPTETSRPGNRGKRDSQLLLMRFLNRVHFDGPMTPAELEIYHQIKNVIGVNPTFYEFLLSVDADTVVDNLSLNMLVANMLRDRKIVGLCGETSLANAKHSFITMLQVYEYFISHHLSKAFESLFSSVTCLPGCFTLFRIRTLEGKPLFAGNELADNFGNTDVFTLHEKNLLHLGEDRFLTTLLLKSFPDHKTTFCRDAKAQTYAPESWPVLLSQRRRWINSTVHNLAELLGVNKLCGFCLFSMRFIVFVDLFATVLQPVTVAYIAYLIYRVSKGEDVPFTALIMIGAIYGLQAILFILHRKFEHIGWMIIYIIGIPLFSLIIPLYSFWHMDDFGWGSTRIVKGERGKTVVVHDEGEFDKSEIPLQTWESYEQELWERGSNASIGSLIAAGRAMDSGRGEGSIYGHESVLDARRSMRPAMPPAQYAGSEYGRSSMYHGEMSSSRANSGFFGGGGDTPPLDAQRVSQFFGVPQQPHLAPYGYDAYPQQSFSGDDIPLQSQQPLLPHSMSEDMAHDSGGAGLRNDASAPERSGMGTGFLSEPLGFLPPDETIASDIREIVSAADLNTLSKKGVKKQLVEKYGVPLGDKTQFVNSEIEAAAMGY